MTIVFKMARVFETKCHYEVALIVMLCCAAAVQLQNCSNICIYFHQASQCQQLNATLTNVVHIENQLSALGNVAEKNVCVYLTSETHFLDQILKLLNKEMKVHGMSNVYHTNITCRNQTGFYFKGKSRILLSNINFQDCNAPVEPPDVNKTIQAALFFHESSYKLENVTLSNRKGVGLYAYNCEYQEIKSSYFHKCAGGNVKIVFAWKNASNAKVKKLVAIYSTELSEGNSKSGGGGIEIKVGKRIFCAIYLIDCILVNNSALVGSHVYIHLHESDMNASTMIYIRHCAFLKAIGRGWNISGTSVTIQSDVYPLSNVTIKESNFTDNENGALALNKAKFILIENCLFNRNNGTGMQIEKQSAAEEIEFVTNIYNTDFYANRRALHLNTVDNKHFTHVKDCSFKGNLMNSENYAASVFYIEGKSYYNPIKREYIYTFSNIFIIENSYFEKNYDILYKGMCSSLYIKDIENATLNDITIIDNNCTGIALHGTALKVLNHLNIVRNYGVNGGAIQMQHTLIHPLNQFHLFIGITSQKYSKLILTNDSQLHFVNNNSTTYGGGIFINETCKERNSRGSCFFELKSFANVHPLLYFKSNRAVKGGDTIFGGCLSNCSIYSNFTNKIADVDITRKEDIFWKFTQFDGLQSTSTFAEYPERVVFCTSNENDTSHNTSLHLTAYRGIFFDISLMVVDKNYHSSVGIVYAKSEPQSKMEIKFGENNDTIETLKYCFTYLSYIITKQELVTLNLLQEGERSRAYEPTQLTVQFEDCPFGFKLNEKHSSCICPIIDQIKCSLRNHSLTVPEGTWIGEIQGRIGVHHECQYCKAEGEQVISDLMNASKTICMQNREGVLCHGCAEGYSLKLGGGYKCDDCSHSTYKGVLLVLLFTLLGITLVMALLKIKLTVSTGFINAFIFYSNIIYSNHDIFLTIDNKVHLNNAITALYTFQAWINLDFGFNVCFFNGLDTYQTVWMQFIFPLYIWILILIMIFTSRYSIRISKLVGENTVSVLATLFLLSYTKLLLTVISVFSYITLSLDNDKQSHPLWIPDANIKYLSGKHIPLFIVSMLVILVYIIPFTLLITCVPFLQKKSKILKWLNKIKPFLNAFYGPYTIKYRYWPGLLLITRLVLLSVFAFYSLGDPVYKLASISVAVSLLFIIWIFIGLCFLISRDIYRNKKINYLEIFFLLNLGIYSVVSLYFKSDNSKQRQQILTIIAVGSAVTVFCVILAHHIFMAVLKFKVAKRMFKYAMSQISKRFHMKSQSTQDESIAAKDDVKKETSSSVTHTTLELREPLLENSTT